MTTENQAPEGGDEREAYVSWLSGNYPRAWPRKDAEHNWQHSHVSALAWQARAALAAQPQAACDYPNCPYPCPDLPDCLDAECATKPQAPVALTDAQVDRLYANVPPSAQQDARSREAFRRLVRVVEVAHGIHAPQTKEPKA